VIYNGRDPALFCPSLRKSGYVLAAGRVWDEAKQVSLLLAKRQAAPVQIAGSYEPPDRTSGVRISDLAAHENVTLLGAQSEHQMRALYANASIYALTSCYEPFGLAALEAALSGCALVANDIPVFHELWGDSAIYFSRNDPDVLAIAIRTLSENPELRENYAQRVRQRAYERFDSQRMVSEYEAAYGQVACQGVAA
jgi:glycosyltransferase involved in cell wall biosynthesis